MQICCFADSREVLPGRAVQRLLLAPEGRLLPAAQAPRVLRDTQAVRVLLLAPAAQARPLAPAARGCHICSDSQASPEDSDGRNRRNVPVASDVGNRSDAPEDSDGRNRRGAPEDLDGRNRRGAPEDSDGRNRSDAPVVLEDCTCQDAYVSQVVLPDSVGAMIYIDQDNP